MTDATAENPICANCESQPCTPKLKGQGLSIYCRGCRDKANAKVNRARARKAEKKRKREIQSILRPIQNQLTRIMDLVSKLPPLPPTKP